MSELHGARRGRIAGARLARPRPTNRGSFEETGVTAHRWIDLGHPTAPIDPDRLDQSMIADYVYLGMRMTARNTWLGAEARE